MARTVVSHFCGACDRKHSSPRWYGSDDYYFCSNQYAKLLRAESFVMHPSWPVLVSHVDDLDLTGCRIVAAKYRADVRAISDGRLLWSMYRDFDEYSVLVMLLAAQYYYPWPMHDFIHTVGRCGTKVSPQRLLSIGIDIFRKYEKFRVCNGVLSAGSRGGMCIKNPSERRTGQPRFCSILEDYAGSMDLCRRMLKYFDGRKNVSMASLLGILGEFCSLVFDGSVCYKNVRCCRLMTLGAGNTFASGELEWEVYRRMSIHVKSTLIALGIFDWYYAEQFIDGLGDLLSMRYTANDFVIFICLAKGITHDDV